MSLRTAIDDIKYTTGLLCQGRHPQLADALAEVERVRWWMLQFSFDIQHAPGDPRDAYADILRSLAGEDEGEGA